jgi:ATP-dependent DNA helicase RecG
VKFFIQLGRAEELGSGAMNVAHYAKAYAGRRKPEFVEGNIFKMKIPIPVIRNEGTNEGVNRTNEGVSEGVNEGVNTRFVELLAADNNRISPNRRRGSQPAI